MHNTHPKFNGQNSPLDNKGSNKEVKGDSLPKFSKIK
jgi:hypothetical protein